MRGAAFIMPMMLAAAAVAADIVDIPRLNGLPVGSGTWCDQGFRVDAVVDVEEGVAHPDAAAARFRLGWTDEGLRVRVEVRDTTPEENAEIWRGDSVEIVFARVADMGNYRLQYIVAPGSTEHFPEPRIVVYDYRLDYPWREPSAMPPPLPAPPYAVTRTDNGYVVDLIAPWTHLDVEAKEGLELGVQVQINNYALGRRRLARWFPLSAGGDGPRPMHPVRLAVAPSVAETMAAGVECPLFRRVSVRAMADATRAGQTLSVAIDGETRGSLALGDARDGWSEGVFTLPLPVPSQANWKTLTVTAVDGVVKTLPIYTLADTRKKAFQRLDIRPFPAVFAGETLPPIDFENPNLAEDCAGEYTLKILGYFDADQNPVTKAEKPGRYSAVVEVTAFGESTRRYFTLYRIPNPDAFNGGRWWMANMKFRLDGIPSGLGVADALFANDPNEVVSGDMRWIFFDALHANPHAATMLAGLAEMPDAVINGQRLPAPLERPGRRHDSQIFALQRKFGDQAPMYDYDVITPRDYDADPEKRWPVVIFLHGSNSSAPLDQLDDNPRGPRRNPIIRENPPFLLVAPQYFHQRDGIGWEPSAVIEVLDDVAKKYRIDPDRICLTGHSMGGHGTLIVGATYPERFAALLPSGAFGKPEDAAPITNVPVWFFHGAKDDMTPVEPLRKIVEFVKANNQAETRYTEYPDMGHDNDRRMYDDPDIYDWILQQRRAP